MLHDVIKESTYAVFLSHDSATVRINFKLIFFNNHIEENWACRFFVK